MLKIDVINRAIQRVGGRRIASLTEDSEQASEVLALYDSVRRAEMRRNVWRFAIRRAVLYSITDTTQLLTFGTWSSVTTYAKGDIVTGSDGNAYQALSGTNLNHDPIVVDSAYWALYFGVDTADTQGSSTAYYVGDLVIVSTSVYLSLINGNTDTAPSANWLTLSTQPTKAALTFDYPIDSGPRNDSSTKNVFRLPVGFLREAPQTPMMPSMPRDWLYEGNYIVSTETAPQVYRFVADVQRAADYDSMFAEGFASRLSLELTQRLTQDKALLQAIIAEYKQFMGDARAVNAIEQGPVIPEEDPWILVKQVGPYSPLMYP